MIYFADAQCQAMATRIPLDTILAKVTDEILHEFLLANVRTAARRVAHSCRGRHREPRGIRAGTLTRSMHFGAALQLRRSQRNRRLLCRSRCPPVPLPRRPCSLLTPPCCLLLSRRKLRCMSTRPPKYCRPQRPPHTCIPTRYSCNGVRPWCWRKCCKITATPFPASLRAYRNSSARCSLSV